MELPTYIVFLPILLMVLTASTASKSVTEISIKPPSSKLFAKLMGMKNHKPKSKSALQRNSARLPKMGFLGGSSYHSMMDDQLLGANPTQDYMGMGLGHLGAQSRLSNFENSPVYYVRLPPTPYMYTPGMAYIGQPPTPSMSNPLRTESFHGNALNNPYTNIPINFLSNGQPNGGYEFGMSELMPNTFPGKGFLRQEPPIFGRRQFFDDSQLSPLKGRFDFNGRADGLYVLPDSSFYQNSMYI